MSHLPIEGDRECLDLRERLWRSMLTSRSFSYRPLSRRWWSSSSLPEESCDEYFLEGGDDDIKLCNASAMNYKMGGGWEEEREVENGVFLFFTFLSQAVAEFEKRYTDPSHPSTEPFWRSVCSYMNSMVLTVMVAGRPLTRPFSLLWLPWPF